LVAKCDEDSRAAKEWARIQELRRLQLPPQVPLPINELTFRQDRVILYRTLHGTVKFDAYLRGQLTSTPDHCLVVLARVPAARDYLHRHDASGPGGGAGPAAGAWMDYFPNFSRPGHLDGLLAQARAAWEGADWGEANPRIPLPRAPRGRGQVRAVFNPFTVFA